MHVAASLAQGAYVLEYTLPVSHTSCLVTFRAAVALLLCYEVSLPFKLPCYCMRFSVCSAMCLLPKLLCLMLLIWR